MEPAAPSAAAPTAKPVRRHPLLALFLSFVWPGLGHMYVGEPRAALVLGLLGVWGPLLLVILWAKTRFSGGAFFWLFILTPGVLRFGAGIHAALKARAQEPAVLRRWQSLLGYATFLFLFAFTNGYANNFVSDRVARCIYGAPTDGAGPEIKKDDRICLMTGGDSRLPRKGVVAAYRKVSASPSAFAIRQEAPMIGKVVAVEGDEVSVTAESVTVNGAPVPLSGGGKELPATKLKYGEAFVLSQSRGAGETDSRDEGPMPLERYAGEVVLVQAAPVK